jgi:hypothetical protein
MDVERLRQISHLLRETYTAKSNAARETSENQLKALALDPLEFFDTLCQILLGPNEAFEGSVKTAAATYMKNVLRDAIEGDKVSL